jgi:hypothetical protein
MNTNHIGRWAAARVSSSLAAAAIAGVAVLAGPAVAAQAATPAPAADTHCVAYLTGDADPICFDTFAKALQKASSGRLTYGPKNAQDAAGDATFRAKVDASNAARSASSAAYDTVISIEYTGSSYSGSDLIWVGTGNCSTSTNNTDYEVGSMPAGWVNVISSYLTFANCWVQHWEDPSHQGAVVGYHGSRSYIGAALDNRTSSQRWS